MGKVLSPKDKLFNPNFTYVGRVEQILKNYPQRSKNLERFSSDSVEKVKNLDNKFIKDGYMYLLRGAKNGQDTGFYSEEYAKRNTIETLNYDPQKVAELQTLYGNTPFISATTDIMVAASFSNKERIYVLKILKEDVYTFFQNEILMETEYMIPDSVSNNEVIRSFKFDRFRQIYNFLTKEIGLDITADDLGIREEELDNVDYERLNLTMHFNNSCQYLDPILDALKEVTDVKLKKYTM